MHAVLDIARQSIPLPLPDDEVVHFTHHPNPTEGQQVFLIGDVHGCCLELRELYGKLKRKEDDMCVLGLPEFVPRKRDSPFARMFTGSTLCELSVIVVGDLVNKGPDSLGCLRFARERGILNIKGNHEVSVISAYYLRKEL